MEAKAAGSGFGVVSSFLSFLKMLEKFQPASLAHLHLSVPDFGFDRTFITSRQLVLPAKLPCHFTSIRFGRRHQGLIANCVAAVQV